MGLELDATGFGLGTRSQRYALIAVDGVIKVLSVESGPGLSCSAADEVLKVVEDAL
jgi:peroxiredoxin